MSERCLISYRSNVTQADKFYDCVYDENGSLEILLKDWVNYDPKTGIYFGPWKLHIRDKELFKNFIKDFDLIKNYCPKLASLDDIWNIFVDGVLIKENSEMNCLMSNFLDIVKKDDEKQENQS